MELLKTGAYLVNGTEIIEDTPEAQARLQAVAGPDAPSKEEAAKGTIAYGILEAHNTSDNMEKLKIRFDKLTSHDITYVGIIQTARASGLEKFPMPYVLTNCHNSLCAVGGTINEKVRWNLCTSSSGSYPSVRKRNACLRWSNDSWF